MPADERAALIDVQTRSRDGSERAIATSDEERASAGSNASTSRNTRGWKIVAACAMLACGALGVAVVGAGGDSLSRERGWGASGAPWTAAGRAIGRVAGGTPRRARASLGLGVSGDYASMGEGALKALVKEDIGARQEGAGLPTFLHVPKTGGTTIESALGAVGIGVGYCHKRPYEPRLKFRAFEPWHTPPARVVPNSWAIVRDPYERAQSEFLWRTSWDAPHVFANLRPGYHPDNCVAFENHIAGAIAGLVKSELRKCYQRGAYTIEHMARCDAEDDVRGMGCNSHYLPQSVMAASASRLFKFEDCMQNEERAAACSKPRAGGKQENIITFLRRAYHPAVSLSSHVNEWNPRIAKPDLGACWAHMNPSVLRDFNDVYRHDINAFHYAMKAPRENAAASDYPPIPAGVAVERTLGEIQDTLPNGEVVQQNVGPRCS